MGKQPNRQPNRQHQPLQQRHFFIMLAIIFFLTLISVTVIYLKFHFENQSIIRLDEQRQRDATRFMSDRFDSGIENYYLENSHTYKGTVYPSRERKRIWTQAEVEQYWIPPSESGIETLRSRNDALIYNSLGLVISSGRP